jgi:SAM-dependent MidA family methyltransferase
VSADEADFGYSTWEVKIAPLSISGGTVTFPEVTAFFSIELALSVEQAVDIAEVVSPASLAEIGSEGNATVSVIEAVSTVEPVPAESARDYDPAIILDPWVVS